MKHRELIVALAVVLLASGCVGYREKLAVQAQLDGNHVRSFNLWRSLARQGHAEAQFRVGLLYMAGHGTQQNETAGLRWFRKAAAKGLVEARSKLAHLYLNGRGNPEQDPDAAQ